MQEQYRSELKRVKEEEGGPGPGVDSGLQIGDVTASAAAAAAAAGDDDDDDGDDDDDDNDDENDNDNSDNGDDGDGADEDEDDEDIDSRDGSGGINEDDGRLVRSSRHGVLLLSPALFTARESDSDCSEYQEQEQEGGVGLEQRWGQEDVEGES